MIERRTEVAADSAPALALSAITKYFGSFKVLDGANFTAHRGEVHALLGENGAGKSSLMNVAAGLYAPDDGTVHVHGRQVDIVGPAMARIHRIGMVHQHFKLVKSFTVAENVLLANPDMPYGLGRRTISEKILERARSLGLAIEPHRRVDALSVAEQQRTEILKNLIAGAEILILDEPTAVLTDDEANRLLTNMRALARSGSAVIVVTHKLKEVMEFCDRVTVMRAGTTLATLEPRMTSTTELTRLAVGSSVVSPKRTPKEAGKSRLYVASLRCARSDGHVMLEDATFSVRDGEIYGIAGVSGNGQSELVEALTGVRLPLSGSIEVVGVGFITDASPERRRAHGVASIPADRYVYGLAGAMSVQDNFAIGDLDRGRYGAWGRVDRRAILREATNALTAFEVQGVRSLRQNAALLSGGNAQKLVLARELSRKPGIIIAHSPSRGLDVRACAAVQGRLLAARDSGAAVLLVSDDLDEVLSLSDRVGVMYRGRIVCEFDAPVDRQAVGNAMVAHG